MGLDLATADQNPSLMPMEASAQMRIQLRKYIDGRAKSAGTYAREAFAKSRVPSGMTVRRAACAMRWQPIWVNAEGACTSAGGRAQPAALGRRVLDAGPGDLVGHGRQLWRCALPR